MDVDKVIKLLGRAIEQRRMKINLTTARLGQRSRLSEDYIIDVEQGVKDLSVIDLYTISQALETTPSELLAWAEALSLRSQQH
jgi:transcriptional regulator with XRE-family HTH domain